MYTVIITESVHLMDNPIKMSDITMDSYFKQVFRTEKYKAVTKALLRHTFYYYLLD